MNPTPTAGHLTWKRIDDVNPPARTLVRAEGIYLHYDDGSHVIDASGGPICVGIGHGRKEIADAVAAQMGKVSYGFETQITRDWAERMRCVTPGDLDRIYPVSGGSEAVESAIRFARHYFLETGQPGRHKIIARWVSYHGNTLGAASLSGGIARRIRYDPMLIPFPHIEPCYCYRCPFHLEYPGCELLCAKKLEEAILREGPESVAAFIAEPIVGATAGVVIPPPGYFREIREICDRYGVLFIADEVMTGFGRTGRWFAMEHWDVVPDIMTVAKGLTSGYIPMGAVCVSRRLMAPAEPRVTDFGNIHTYSYHPVAAAAACAVLDIIERENLVERSRVMGEYLLRKLEPIREQPNVGDVRGLGLFAGVELVKNKAERTPFARSEMAAERVLAACLARGASFYSAVGMVDGRAGDAIMIAPPFIVTESQIDEIVAILVEGLDGLQR